MAAQNYLSWWGKEVVPPPSFLALQDPVPSTSAPRAGTGETNWLISLTWLICKGYSQRYPAGPQLQSGYLSKWVKLIRGLWRNTYSCVGEGQRLWPKDSIQLNTSICPLEKRDPRSRINSWLTVSYSAETTNFCLPRTLPIVMMPKSLATSILLPTLVLRSPCAANYDKMRQKHPEVHSKLIPTHPAFPSAKGNKMKWQSVTLLSRDFYLRKIYHKIKQKQAVFSLQRRLGVIQVDMHTKLVRNRFQCFPKQLQGTAVIEEYRA